MKEKIISLLRTNARLTAQEIAEILSVETAEVVSAVNEMENAVYMVAVAMCGEDRADILVFHARPQNLVVDRRAGVDDIGCAVCLY